MQIPSFIHLVAHTKYQDVGNKDIYLAKTKDYMWVVQVKFKLYVT